MKQKTLFKLSEYKSDFGGELLILKRKRRRPLSNKNSIHLVLRADISKSGSILKYKNQIEKIFNRYTQRFQVRLYKKALVSNHIHILARFESRQSYIQFIRSLTGQLAQTIGLRWQHRPWSRVVNWGRSFQIAMQYIIKNQLEADGVIRYQPRRKMNSS